MYESLNKLAPTDEQAHTELTFDPRESKARPSLARLLPLPSRPLPRLSPPLARSLQLPPSRSLGTGRHAQAQQVRALQSNAATYAEIGSVIDADDSGYSAWQTGELYCAALHWGNLWLVCFGGAARGVLAGRCR